ncbi:unnamed protein product [Penicillium manginii]
MLKDITSLYPGISLPIVNVFVSVDASASTSTSTSNRVFRPHEAKVAELFAKQDSVEARLIVVMNGFDGLTTHEVANDDDDAEADREDSG